MYLTTFIPFNFTAGLSLFVLAVLWQAYRRQP